LTDFKSFSVSPAPHPADSHELFSTFVSEAAELPTVGEQDYQLTRALLFLSEIPGNTIKHSPNGRILLHVKTINEPSNNNMLLDPTVMDIYKLAQTRKLSISVMFTPSASKSTKPSQSPFGLTKRAAKAQRAPPEQPLISEKYASSKTSPSAAPISPVRTTKVLTGAIPTCFSSQSSCERSTNNCTSHGECLLKWSTETMDEGGSVSKQDCFGCACTKPDVRTNKDGTKKTTNYGGGACHKKDIVFPFWLLAGTTVFIIFIISFGVGLLYEMGNQELPSVIGAGVSGPKGSR
jgi:hypothetical protein